MTDKQKYREVAITSDGSATLFVPFLDEHYHSFHGAIQEAKHVFIEAGLKYYIEKKQPETIHVFEMGFGTGLNACLTVEAIQGSAVKVIYHAIEAHPLNMQEVESLTFFEDNIELRAIYLTMHEAEWDKPVQITDNFIINKHIGYLEDWTTDVLMDIVYYDAFAPSAQPHLWTSDIFEKIYSMTANDGVLVTYCAKGVVKRTLKAIGWNIEKLPGPPGKREMTRANK